MGSQKPQLSPHKAGTVTYKLLHCFWILECAEYFLGLQGEFQFVFVRVCDS